MASSATVERDALIVQEYLSGRNVAEICREHKIGERQFYSIVARSPLTEGRREARAPRKPLSQVHLAIGRHLHDYYFSRSFDRTSAANKLGWSALRLRNVEQGFVDLTLFELQDIVAFTRTPIEILFNVR